MINTSVSSQSYAIESISLSLSIQALKKQIKKNSHILSIQHDMTSIKNFPGNMGYQAWTSNMDQDMLLPMTLSMSAHVALQMTTPMYPLFIPIYRLRP
jgi:hypothetical protein